jgi:hypothetical protein
VLHGGFAAVPGETVPACSETKALDEFNRNRSRHDGLETRCRQCQGAYSLARQRGHRARLDAIKAAAGCAHCGARPDDPASLAFDHMDPSTKDRALAIPSRVARGSSGSAINPLWSWARIEREIGKCQVLCIPCHAVKTHAERAQRKTDTAATPLPIAA